MGRGSGSRGSGSRSAEFNVNYEFELFTQDDSGNLREDIEGDLTNNIGIFPNAIENFQITINETSDLFLFDGSDAIQISSNQLNGFPAEVPNEINLDLTARFVPAGQTISLPDGGVPVFPSGDPSSIEDDINNANPRTTSGARIEYSLTSSELASVGVDEITLVLRDSTDTPNNADLASLDIQRAINDIDYIVEENLLGNIADIRVSGPASTNPSILISREGAAIDPDLGFGSDGSSSIPIAPIAVNDSASTLENTAVDIDVLDNDNVGTIESFNLISTSGGSIVQNGGLLEYTPATGFVGQDTFQYTIDNLGLESTATVTVNVTETETPVVPIPPTTPETPTTPEVPTTPEPPTETPLLDGDDVISGDNGDNTLLGGEGNNILYGFGGDDVLRTGSGSDNLQGDNGDDDLAAGGGKDII
ncbi:MAG: Ig-like domain-containing protein, partial [Cyanobacteria bacterium J06631_2]